MKQNFKHAGNQFPFRGNIYESVAEICFIMLRFVCFSNTANLESILEFSWISLPETPLQVTFMAVGFSYDT
jgi:hypothetical protein